MDRDEIKQECHTIPRADSGVGRCEIHGCSIWECRYRFSETELEKLKVKNELEKLKISVSLEKAFEALQV